MLAIDIKINTALSQFFSRKNNTYILTGLLLRMHIDEVADNSL